MKNYVDYLTGNHVLNVAIVSWFAAQVLKIVIALIKTKKLRLGLIFSSGGMPSSHSSTVVGCAVAVANTMGIHSVEFAIAAVLAMIVMYDASGVRRETGKQAKILNYIMEHWREMPPDIFQRELKELVGHTPIEVLAGAVLGFIIGMIAM